MGARHEPAESPGEVAQPMPTELHVVVNRKEFLSAFGKVAKAAPTRSPRPILQNVKLVASDDPDVGTTLTATDLEVGIRLRVRGVDVLAPGSAILPTAKVQSILASSKDAELDISIDGEHIVVKSPSATFRLPSQDPSLYPEVPQFSGEMYHAIAAPDMRKLIRRTAFCADLESTRYALSGMLAEFGPDSMTFVGTDGRRLAKMTVPADSENGGGDHVPGTSPVIPVKALRVIDANLDDLDAIVHLAIGKSGALVRTSDGSTVIYSRLVEGRFPRYQDAILSNPEVRIPLDATALRGAVEQASIVTSEDSRGVSFSYGAGMLTLSSQAADVGSSKVTMPTGYDGPEIIIDFDPRYVLDGLKTIEDGEVVTFEAIDEKHAGNFVTDDGYILTVMPLTRSR